MWFVLVGLVGGGGSYVCDDLTELLQSDLLGGLQGRGCCLSSLSRLILVVCPL